MNRKYSFFYHYNKPASKAAGQPKLSVHYRGKCYIVDSLECHCKTESKVRNTQPHVVIAGKCDGLNLVEEDNKTQIIIT